MKREGSGIGRWFAPARVTAPLPRQFASLAASNAATGGLSFAVLVVLARALGTDELGQVVFAQASAASLFALLDPRLEDALVRYVPIVARRNGHGAATALFRRFLLIDQLLGALFAGVAIAIVVSDLIPLGPSGDATFLALALAQTGGRAAQGTASAGYSVTHGLSRFGAVQGAAAFGTSAAALFGLAIDGATGYMAGAAAGTAVATVGMSVGALRRVEADFGPADPASLRPVPGMLRFTWKSSIASSLALGTDVLPLTVVGAVAGPQTLALVRIALGPARIIASLYSPVASVLFPVFTRDAAHGALDSIPQRARRFTFLSLPIALAGTLLSWFVLPALLPLVFGQAFEGAVTAAILLMAAALLRGSVVWSKVLALAIGRPGIRIGVLVLDAGLTVGGTYVLADQGATAVGAVYLGAAVLSVAAWLVFLPHAARYAERWDEDLPLPVSPGTERANAS